jgi:hypothetical protein
VERLWLKNEIDAITMTTNTKKAPMQIRIVRILGNKSTPISSGDNMAATITNIKAPIK